MRFKVGPWEYRLRIKRGLVDADGVACDGLCDWADRSIWIDSSVQLRRRLFLLVHELRHAWQHDMGRPVDDEADANQVATFTIDVWRQIERNGGEAALMRLDEDGVVNFTAAAPRQSPSPPRSAQCPRCNGYLNHPLQTGPAEFDAEHQRLAAWRKGGCDFCGHDVVWREAVTTLGIPTGEILSPPVLGRLSLSGHGVEQLANLDV